MRHTEFWIAVLLAAGLSAAAVSSAKAVTLEAHFTLHGSMALWTSLGSTEANFTFEHDGVEIAAGQLEITGNDPIVQTGVLSGALGSPSGNGVDAYFVISHSFSVAFTLDSNDAAPISWHFTSDGRYGVADFSSDFAWNLTGVGVCCRSNEGVNDLTAGLILTDITLAGGAPVSSIGKQIEFIAAQTRMHAEATNGADTPQDTITLADASSLYVRPTDFVASSRIDFLGGAGWRFQTSHEPNPFVIDSVDAEVGYFRQGSTNLPNIRLVDLDDGGSNPGGGNPGGAGVPVPGLALLLVLALGRIVRRPSQPTNARSIT